MAGHTHPSSPLASATAAAARRLRQSQEQHEEDEDEMLMRRISAKDDLLNQRLRRGDGDFQRTLWGGQGGTESEREREGQRGKAAVEADREFVARLRKKDRTLCERMAAADAALTESLSLSAVEERAADEMRELEEERTDALHGLHCPLKAVSVLHRQETPDCPCPSPQSPVMNLSSSSSSRFESGTESAAPTPRLSVDLLVYDLHRFLSLGNRALELAGRGGAYHVSVLVGGKLEWAFGGSSAEGATESRGILGRRRGSFKSWANVKPAVIPMGSTSLSMEEMLEVADRMHREGGWKLFKYHVLEKNCIHFAEAFVSELGDGVLSFPAHLKETPSYVRSLPDWMQPPFVPSTEQVTQRRKKEEQREADHAVQSLPFDAVQNLLQSKGNSSTLQEDTPLAVTARGDGGHNFEYDCELPSSLARQQLALCSHEDVASSSSSSATSAAPAVGRGGSSTPVGSHKKIESAAALPQFCPSTPVRKKNDGSVCSPPAAAPTPTTVTETPTRPDVPQSHSSSRLKGPTPEVSAVPHLSLSDSTLLSPLLSPTAHNQAEIQMPASGREEVSDTRTVIVEESVQLQQQCTDRGQVEGEGPFRKDFLFDGDENISPDCQSDLESSQQKCYPVISLPPSDAASQTEQQSYAKSEDSQGGIEREREGGDGKGEDAEVCAGAADVKAEGSGWFAWLRFAWP
uniref:PPPDE domain-containing protein n=1 Tax=Chromera velia CCMP2878 TaxID=1169474 RepID=A0A0G4HHP2_9ALVE|eukprot:Cvel_6850.t1-p1 / transcript=Cvel_6850.t1 / gene=Cvel_6850 / organism=Chromera_velia_CCMP2878 / gene_product=hypothetical protein / transcript_product=hypothetical protein / location=Cvel_scaffold345:79460-81829(-) / protein_length=688 / sequence_SO=supercontig / SO=protein_coding / is_pseudo=false